MPLPRPRWMPARKCTLISADLSFRNRRRPAGSVRSAAEMLEAVLAETSPADVLIMAAAVADFRPAQAARQKIKKQAASRS